MRSHSTTTLLHLSWPGPGEDTHYRAVLYCPEWKKTVVLFADGYLTPSGEPIIKPDQ